MEGRIALFILRESKSIRFVDKPELSFSQEQQILPQVSFDKTNIVKILESIFLRVSPIFYQPNVAYIWKSRETKSSERFISTHEIFPYL